MGPGQYRLGQARGCPPGRLEQVLPLLVEALLALHHQVGAKSSCAELALGKNPRLDDGKALGMKCEATHLSGRMARARPSVVR